MRLLLASASPRRRELLLAAGFECEILPVPIDERRLEAEQPAQYVERLARQKAAAAAARAPEAFVLGADTVVVQGSEVFGKPADAENAAAMLRRLSGRAHDVFTGVALAWPGGIVADVDRTRVWMNALTETDIASYLATGEPFDKAGAYGIQGWASRFIPRIEGSYSNVVGLPVALVVQLLDRARAAK
ncbi:MAG TPA: Maf family protein [Vicinamibacterales bacterium]|nr:Maf family protein [Vicinamibacterales bacterium]